MTAHRIRPAEEWDAARADAAGAREGAHPDGRRTGTAAPGASLGTGREAVHAPDGGRPEDARGAVRRPLPAADLPLHVRPELRGRLPGELLDRRLVRQSDPAPEGSGRDVDRRLRGADREAAGLSRADGVELQLGVELRERFQRRPRFLEQPRADAGGDRAEFSTSCLRSPSATPRSPARTSTVT